MDIKQQVINLINATEAEYITARQLYGALQTSSTAQRNAVKEALAELTEQCVLVYDKRNNRYRKLREGETGVAIFLANARGFGFLSREEGDDLFVAPGRTHGAFHRDRVLYRLLGGTRDEAEVLRVLERGMTHLVGTYRKQEARFVIPDEQRFVSDVFIPPKRDMGAKNGQKVVVHITQFPEDGRLCPEGEIVQILGYPNSPGVDMLSVAASFGLTVFPENVLRAAEAVPQSVGEAELEGRRDLRGECIFTIDGEDAKDLDDAVSISQSPDGTYTLGVHIADVSHYVPAGSDIDREAFARGTSVYLPQTVFPMLPQRLSNGICSLYEGVDRLTLSCEMKIDCRGKVLDFNLFPSVINSRHRMTYTAVQAILDGDEATCERYADIVGSLKAMERLARILQEARNRRGNIELASREVVFVYDADGRVEDLRLAEDSFSHALIEEFMIAANECVARYARDLELPFVYRVHDKPVDDKLKALFALLDGLGLSVRRTREIHNSVLQSALLKAAQTPYFELVNEVLLRTMQRARYSDSNSGHFGLASECYCHFTSPIRRYADLAVHRVLKAVLCGTLTQASYNDLADSCAQAARQASARERLADEAERRAVDVKKCEYALRIVGRAFSAVVSGVTERGIFARSDNTLEGFVPIEQLGDGLAYRPERFCLEGDSVRYSLGDKVTVRVASVNRQACRIDLELLPPSTAV